MQRWGGGGEAKINETNRSQTITIVSMTMALKIIWPLSQKFREWHK